jgi:hypothetical protein
MKLRAEIHVEIDAADFVEAAEHQQRLQMLFRAVKAEYGQAKFLLRTVRTPNHRMENGKSPIPKLSGIPLVEVEA